MKSEPLAATSVAQEACPAFDPAALEPRLERMSQLMRRMVRTLRVPDDQVDLTPTQLVVLSHLNESPMRIGSLARAVGAAQNTISEVVARLQRAGLVNKTRDLDDHRAVVVAITEQGARALDTRRATIRRYHRAVLEALPDRDQQRLVDAFELLVGMAERARTAMANDKRETRRKK